MASSSITSWQIDGKKWKQWQILFSWAPKSLWTVTAAMILEDVLLGRKAMIDLDGVLESRGITLPTKVHIVKTMVFPVVMYGCESWTIKKVEHRRCFWTVVLEKTLESPVDCKEIQPANSKTNQSWIFIGKTDDEAPILWPPDAKNRLIGKDPDVGEDWRQEEKGTTEDEMVGWHHQLDGYEFEQAPGIGDGQRSLVCCSLWGCSGSDTERLNWLTGTVARVGSRIRALTQWTWVWANSGKRWRTEKSGVLQSMGSQRVGHSLVTEQQKRTRR